MAGSDAGTGPAPPRPVTPAATTAVPSWLRFVATLWGIGGIVAMLVNAISRLTPHAVEALRAPLPAWQWILVVLWTVWMLWTEGYRGFIQGFAPRVAARARYLRRHGRWTHVLLAPLFCFGFIHITRRGRIRAIIFSIAILTLVILVRRLPQPWRGIVDTGVVAGLVVGVAALLYFVVRALRDEEFPYSGDLPDE